MNGRPLHRALLAAVEEDEYSRTRKGRTELAAVLEEMAERWTDLGMEQISCDFLTVALVLQRAPQGEGVR